MKKKKTTTDGLAIIHNQFFAGKPERLAELEEARANDEVARHIYRLRVGAGLSQRELGILTDTTTSVISRLEEADYEGHSMAMLRRIAAALKKRVEIRFVPLKKSA